MCLRASHSTVAAPRHVQKSGSRRVPWARRCRRCRRRCAASFLLAHQAPEPAPSGLRRRGVRPMVERARSRRRGAPIAGMFGGHRHSADSPIGARVAEDRPGAGFAEEARGLPATDRARAYGCRAARLPGALEEAASGSAFTPPVKAAGCRRPRAPCNADARRQPACGGPKASLSFARLGRHRSLQAVVHLVEEARR